MGNRHEQCCVRFTAGTGANPELHCTPDRKIKHGPICILYVSPSPCTNNQRSTFQESTLLDQKVKSFIKQCRVRHRTLASAVFASDSRNPTLATNNLVTGRAHHPNLASNEAGNRCQSLMDRSRLLLTPDDSFITPRTSVRALLTAAVPM